VVEHLDDLEVGVVGQRQDHVAGAEARVHAAVDEGRAEKGTDALRRRDQPTGSGGEREVVETHAEIVDGHRATHQSGVAIS
jgi:hypothetical protein